MLQLVLGRAGSGKTRWVYDRIEELARRPEGPRTGPIVLLVPEQFSFESERLLLGRLGARLATEVLVLSFTRLAETVFRETGGPSGARLDDGARALLMNRALDTVADQLKLYRRQAADADTVSSLLSLLAECRQGGVTPHMLEEAAASLPAGTLRDKAGELALILGAYDALTAAAYSDPLDDLDHLAARLPESRLLSGAAVFVDGFKGFTAQETAVLAGVLRQAEEVAVTLCAGSVNDPEEGCG